LEETRAILAEVAPGVTLDGWHDDLVEVQGATVADVAHAKAKQAAELLQCPVLVEDFGLCIRALGGFPGPYVKWFMKPLGPDGLWTIMSRHDDRHVEAVSVFAYCSHRDKEPILFEGRCEGTIVSPKGVAKFGADAVFQPTGYEVTYAEMDDALKNSMSHRFKALQKLKAEIASWLVHQTISPSHPPQPP